MASAISCARPGYCVVGGVEFHQAHINRPVLSVETNGTWAKPQIIAGASAGASSTIVQVECPRVGACVALGQLISKGPIARFSSYFVVQHGSRWASAQMIPTSGLGAHPSYLLTAMTCVKAGSCVLAGTLLVSPTLDRVFSLTWRNGHWGAPYFLGSSALGVAARLMSLSALNCVRTWCEGVGLYTNASKKLQPYVVTYSGGIWHTMHPLAVYRSATNVNLLSSISCTAVGTCVAGGQSDPLKGAGSSALVVEEHHGHWATPYAFGSANVMELISCTAATSCTGVLTHSTGAFAGVVTMSSSRHWSVTTSASVVGWSNLQGWAMSCAAGQCTIAGSGSTSPTGPPEAIVMTSSVG